VDPQTLDKRFRAAILSSHDEREVRVAVGAFALVAARGFGGLIEDLVGLSKRWARDPINLFRVQMWMLEALVQQESWSRGFKERLKEADKSGDEIPEEQRIVIETELYASRLVRKAIRAVGDGIVWRLLGHDRGAYYVLAQGHAQGAALSTGLLAELRALGDAVLVGKGVPLLSALTNVVRYGDLIIVSDEQSDDERITLVEVKTGKDRSPRFRRQRGRMAEVITLLEERAGSLNEIQVTIDARDVVQESYLPAVLNVIQEAQGSGAAGRLFDGYLRVECFALESARADSEGERIKKETASVVGRWRESGDYVVDGSNWELKVSTPNIAPYSVYPFPESIRAGLLTNRICVRSWVNLDEVLRRCARAGWEIERDFSTEMMEVLGSGRDPSEASVARLRKGPLVVNMPPGRVARLLYEYLKPRSIVRELELISRLPPGSERMRSLSYYPGEARAWD